MGRFRDKPNHTRAFSVSHVHRCLAMLMSRKRRNGLQFFGVG